jgi:hypothetical protein
MDCEILRFFAESQACVFLWEVFGLFFKIEQVRRRFTVSQSKNSLISWGLLSKAELTLWRNFHSLCGRFLFYQ